MEKKKEIIKKKAIRQNVYRSTVEYVLCLKNKVNKKTVTISQISLAQ